MRYRLYGAMVSLLLVGCSKKPTHEPPEIEGTLHQYILPSIPADIPYRTFVDFGGKVRLVGYEMEPELARPGADINLTLYWQPVARLDPGWRLFTHILEGNRMANFDYVGPLRDLKPDATGQTRPALPPSQWQPGKVYVDKQSFKMPTCLREVVADRVDCVDLSSPEVTLAVGLWREVVVGSKTNDGTEGEAEPQRLHLRMPVISGASDGENRAIVAHIKTGVVLRRVAATTE